MPDARLCRLAPAGVRMPQAPLGGGLANDQLAQLAQLGLLGKQAPAQAPGANLGISAQQQAALLNALQVGSGVGECVCCARVRGAGRMAAHFALCVCTKAG